MSSAWHVIRYEIDREIEMSDSFLEEQVRRIKQLTERMSQVTDRREVENGIARDRQFSSGPLHDVRDMRIVSSVPQAKREASDSTPRRSRRRRR
jgi:hypothetical protein